MTLGKNNETHTLKIRCNNDQLIGKYKKAGAECSSITALFCGVKNITKSLDPYIFSKKTLSNCRH